MPSVAAMLTSGLAMLLLVAAGLGTSPPNRATPDPQSVPRVIESVHRVSRSVVSGAQPRGATAFAALHRQGIRTIVSVDGARPDVAVARQFGLRYVHIPIGYDGLPAEALQKLTRVMRECRPPVYVHCHHGKHRGPAAAAICALIAGELDHADAIRFLERAGTGREYAGLWRDVRAFAPLPDDAPLPQLSETVEPEPLVDVMVAIDATFEELVGAVRSKETARLDLSTPSETSALAWELASRLREEFREAARLGPARSNDDLYRELLTAEQAALDIATAARDGRQPLAPLIDRLQETCRSCHQRQRN